MKFNGFSRDISFFSGRAEGSITMKMGNFDVKDTVTQCVPVSSLENISCEERNGLIYIHGKISEGECNRIWIRISADSSEHVIGGGEQFSCLDLRGKSFPIWTREQGVGRNKKKLITILADKVNAGGDYHTTYFPQPTFISSNMYFAHIENTEYSVLDFTHSDYHEICIWSNEFSLVIGTAPDYSGLLEKLTELLGRQPVLPDWAMKGIWLGVQGGTERVAGLLKKCEDGGIDIPVVWIQDWEGIRITSFGKRLNWDWYWNSELYPGLPEIIENDNDHKWMAYINPYIIENGRLFNIAQKNSYLVKNAEGDDYVFDFGEFNCGIVDLTLPEAFDWYKNFVVKKNIIDMGFRGWMADFGEYLPYDAVCHGGSGSKVHNLWPVLWARCCREAVDESGLSGQCVFFTRSGGAGSGAYSTLQWAGDQNVDWSEDDGLASVITSAISLGMSGVGLQCSDCGGYTTLLYLHRTEELMLRWLEYSCFTPVMRTHEGNRPDSNIQLYSNDTLISAGAKFSKMHTAMLPYMRECVELNSKTGTPVMRPLFYEEPKNDALYSRNLFSYMLGSDIVVAPVVKKGASSRKGILPNGNWVHLWSGEKFKGGPFKVSAPMGKIPVFYKEDSPYAPLFESLKSIE